MNDTTNESMSAFALTIFNQKYAHEKADGTKESLADVGHRVSSNVFGATPQLAHLVQPVARLIAARKFLPGGRYLYAAGRAFHQTQNCLLLSVEDSREGWAALMHKSTMALMTGAGIGVDYSKVRCKGSPVVKTGGVSTGPIALMQMINEAGRGIMQGGSRRSAIWAGLNWKHADIFEFIGLKNWSPDVVALKNADYNFPAPMDGTNISVLLDDEFFVAMQDAAHVLHTHAQRVYWSTVQQMLQTAEPGFSVDVGDNAGQTLRNACTEVTSADDSDICNLGSINLARIDTLEEFEEVLDMATAFLLAGTLYSHIPYDEVGAVRTKNRRLGLGLMGIHEWLLKRGKTYGPDAELEQWLKAYARSTKIAARYAAYLGISAPIATRAIAPTGTIGIIAETSTGLEPLFCAAFIRAYREGEQGMSFQYVLDPTAKRLVDAGVDPDTIEDAYTLAENPERRVAFQAWVQQYVDHGISSTLNLPPWGSPHNGPHTVEAFGTMLLQYLPQLRGITCYPDGARGGQPLTRVSYREAVDQVGRVFSASATVVEQQDVCDISKGGSCGV